jgi:hypothetical protein
LNPLYQYGAEFIGSRDDLITSLRKVIETIEPDYNRQVAALNEVKRFKDRLGAFSSQASLTAARTQPPSKCAFS